MDADRSSARAARGQERNERGVAGALMAVPILVTFKSFCDHIEPLSPIGEFLGR